MQEIHSISSSLSILILHILVTFILVIFLIGCNLESRVVGMLLRVVGGGIGVRYRLEACLVYQ